MEQENYASSSLRSKETKDESVENHNEVKKHKTQCFSIKAPDSEDISNYKDSKLSWDSEVIESNKDREFSRNSEVTENNKDSELSRDSEVISNNKDSKLSRDNEVMSNNKDSELSRGSEVMSNNKDSELSRDMAINKQNGDSCDRTKERNQMVGVFEIFRFADVWDILLMFFGTICSFANGVPLPALVILFGDMTDLFIDHQYYQNVVNSLVENITIQYPYINTIFPNATSVVKKNPLILWTIIDYLNISYVIPKGMNETLSINIMDKISTYSIYYTILGGIALVLGYLQLCFWQLASTRQTRRIRMNLFRCILHQDIGWFDTQSPGTMNTRLSEDVVKVTEGTGEKLSIIFQQIAQFTAAFVIGFVKGWKLTLVVLSIFPVLGISFAVVNRLLATITTKELKAYAKAGAIAEEVFSCIRTVTAFGGQNKECKRYKSNLYDARKFGIKKGCVQGISTGIVYFLIFNIYAVGFWYGFKLTREDDHYTVGTLLIVFFSVVIASSALGNAAPNLGDFAIARGAAYAIFNIINTVPEIDSVSPKGIRPENFVGNIEFRNVVFRYPSRPSVTILQGLSFKVKVGQTVALVGSSGCGKSTIVQLLQRFYDPISGQVLIDGQDVKNYNIKWLRQQIGVVSQEPVLFASSIAENIRFGHDGASIEDIEQAARQANAHDFISKLPKGYDTLVGERGAQLSGGQKQRIAIARALVRNPKILLLDEATSALDNESESIVQDALNKARLGRTTIVIAHRLSTIKIADVIMGVMNGGIVEKGTHNELMKLGGLYKTLVTNQTKKIDDKEDEGDDETVLLQTETSDENGLYLEMTNVIEKEEISPLVNVYLSKVGFFQLMKMNAPEWVYILFGSLSGILVGFQMPAFALLFGSILGVFSIADESMQQNEINKYCLIFFILSFVVYFSFFVMSYLLAISGENLTLRLRESVFRAILRQDMQFFDKPENNPGALCTKLATEASAVQGATGARLGLIIQSFSAVCGALVIGFIYSWRLALLLLAYTPFLIMAGVILTKFVFNKRSDSGNNVLMEEGGKVTSEALENIRTVVALTKEEYFYEQYCNKTAPAYRHELRMSHLSGLAYGFSLAINFFNYATAFYVGGKLISEGYNTYEELYKVFTATVFGTMTVGQAASLAPNYSKAKLAAARLLALTDTKPSIDSLSEDGKELQSFQGEIAFKNVRFNYPARPNVEILSGVDIFVQPGRRIALVGSSGCGKSTAVQLLERFYDPLQGQVMVDNVDIKTLNVQWLRSNIGLVSQEPVLFNCSIRENIVYGDNTREISMSEIIKVAVLANIHTFISSLPYGYDTEVGDKGTQLSGGQKQRIAIARALIRNPKILLLDEATSALDTENENIVQEALDRAQQGRTSIVIAHRLSTIQDADLIVCMKNGRVLEQGKHSGLMAAKGLYYRLNMAQLNK